MESSPLLHNGASNKRTCIITGGNSGLGLECAKALCENAGLHIVLACRNTQSAQDAITSIRQGGCHDPVARAGFSALRLDLASLASIREFSREVASLLQSDALPPLHGLVLNAGVQVVTGLSKTADGFEATFGVNHLGHFLLANLLLKHLVAPARVVFVSSDTHDPTKNTGMPLPQFTTPDKLAFPDAADAQADPTTWGRQAYTTSKLCNIFCAYELARRLAAAGIPASRIAVSAFNPGMMPGTGLARDYSGPMQFGWKYILPAATLFSSAIRTPAASGKALAEVASDISAKTALYFDGAAEIRSSDESYDLSKAADLWIASARLVQLHAEDTIVSVA
jgi:NAD(P)-dependent dehydrogenase (short-subunit alcohol dehydrogenase family)